MKAVYFSAVSSLYPIVKQSKFLTSMLHVFNKKLLLDKKLTTKLKKVRVGRKAVSFQSVIGLFEYSVPECLDNSVTRQEVTFWRTFSAW